VGSRTSLWADLCTVDYKEAWDLQRRLVAARKSPTLRQDLFILLEHPSVFTLGRRGGRENLKVTPDFLEKQGIRVFHVERGGNITFHGPGQLVGYGIVDLNAARLTVTDYVEGLEEAMIRTAWAYGVRAERNQTNRGVWVGKAKLGSVGIGIHHGTTFHGFAFNVNTGLEPFSWINPCGLVGVAVTSLKQELGRELAMTEVRASVKASVGSIFDIKLADCSMPFLQALEREPTLMKEHTERDHAVHK
jgi:lipoate-protein ligase B